MYNYIGKTAATLLGAAVVTVAAQVNQQFPNMPTPAELAMLPEFCNARIGSNGKLYEVWLNRMGHDKFVHVHHYCHGLNAMNRVPLAMDKRTRRNLLLQATQEFAYVIQRWPPGYDLTIDAKRRQALAQSLLQGS